MARVRCCGVVDDLPKCRRFLANPCGGTAVTLHVEEFEAVRLKEYRRLDQAEAAACMKLSRPTFQRILCSARRKIAAALVEGRELIIEGGSYVMANRVFECQECKHEWEVPPCSEGGKHGYEIACPQCGSMQKVKLENGTRHACTGHQGGHGEGSCGCGHHHS